MKTKNTHGCYDHTSNEDQKAMFIARLFASIVMIAALAVLTITALYLRELQKQDADLKTRTEYIESGHSEL